MKYLNKWLKFIKERFNPITYTLMILSFFGSHYVFYVKVVNNSVFSITSLVPMVLVTGLFFFKLRLLDEVKDIETDKEHHPHRPLPRGLLKEKEVLNVAFGIMILEIFLFSFYGLWGFFGALVTVFYSFLMYKEFFIKKWIRSHLTTYAVTHTFVSFFMSSTIFVSLFNRPVNQIPINLFFFSLANWCVFNVFEFGRKTFASLEEKNAIDSYSKNFGKIGAVLLVLIMGITNTYLVSKLASNNTNKLILLLLLPIIISGIFYTLSENKNFAKAYRFSTSIYIIFVYLIIILFR